ncbi:MAG: hypothetical protein WBQ25_26300 [Nitrososphaeraceae archaeon]
MKEILCIPHALAEDRQIKWTLPLIIRNANKEFKIHLLVNKFNDTIHTEVDEAHYDLSGATEVEVILPIIEKLTSTISLANYMRTYAMFVTHIRFTLIDEDKELTSFMSLDATQQINTKWKNLSSAHWYKRPEFHRLLSGLSKENSSSETWSALYNIIRETSNLKKDKAPESKLTLSEIVRSNKNMNSLHDKLKQWMDASSTLSLPFDTAKRVRMKALKERIEKGIIGHSVDNSKMKYKQVFGVYTDDSDKGSELQIPFFYEIMIFHDIKNTIDTLMVKQALNCSAVPTVATIFRGEDKFYWFPTDSKFRWQAYSIDSILEHYGYSINKKNCKKPHSLILINLVSPKLNYRSYGKSRIDFSPFASAIAETTIKACMGGGRGSDGKPAKNSVLLDILRDRKDKWESMDPMERIKNWWTMSDVFYATRKKLIEYGYTNDEINRNYITSLIKSTCKEDLHVKREEIGIIAADRAQLYFKKQWMDVGLEEIKELVEYGTDMLIIEKEGVVEQLKIICR